MAKFAPREKIKWPSHEFKDRDDRGEWLNSKVGLKLMFWYFIWLGKIGIDIKFKFLYVGLNMLMHYLTCLEYDCIFRYVTLQVQVLGVVPCLGVRFFESQNLILFKWKTTCLPPF